MELIYIDVMDGRGLIQAAVPDFRDVHRLRSFADSVEKAFDDVECLQEECAELKKDAARYRWLRQMDRADSWSSLLAPNVIKRTEDIDAAIDAALVSPNAN